MKQVRVVGLMLLVIGFTVPAVGCAAPGEPRAENLVGTEWVLTSLTGNSLIKDTEITLQFEREYLTGSMGCNGYGGGLDSGKYAAADDGTLTVSQPLAVTVQLCSEPEGIMEQEAAYISALQGAAAYQVTEGRLEIEDASGETVLVFARQE